ncbi:hypothetical protein SRHO_G00095930 [Serrasalmus rhombeus]
MTGCERSGTRDGERVVNGHWAARGQGFRLTLFFSRLFILEVNGRLLGLHYNARLCVSMNCSPVWSARCNTQCSPVWCKPLIKPYLYYSPAAFIQGSPWRA